MPNKGVYWKDTMWKMSDGKSVMQFCRETGANYHTILRYVARTGSVDEACRIGLERKGNKDGNTKYFVDGMPLRKYCLKNGLNYQKLLREKRKAKNNVKNSNS